MHLAKTCGLVVLVFALAGCRPFWLQTVTPAGPPEYRLGWEDGCDTGLSAEGSWDYKLIYGYKKRPEMAPSETYKAGWNEGFSYCRFSLAASKDGGGDSGFWGGGGNIHANESLPW